METYKILLIFQLFWLTANTSEINSCEAFTEPNFNSSLFSIKDLDIIYDLTLIQRNTEETIKSVRLQPSCKLLACSEPKLKGKCEEQSTNGNLKEPKTFKSFSCKCSQSLRTARKIETPSRCGNLYKNWYYSGPHQSLLFPGTTSKLEFTSVGSVLVKEGCEIVVWRQEGEKQISSSFGDSLTFLDQSDENEIHKENSWACCYCGKTSERICNNAKNISTFKTLKNTEDEDFSDFVKHGKKIIGIGRNYRWKASELTKVLKEPTEPIVFLKPSTSYIQEGQQIQLPQSLGTIFYEIELGIVIGKGGKSIQESSALDHVAGYFLALDMTAKEFLKRSINQSLPWEISKGFDTACPVSHFIPKHLIPNPNDVYLECRVNGKVTQSDNTKNMIFNVPKLISYVSKYMTFEPFDSILTGTPDGLGPVYGGDVIQGFLGNLTSIQFDTVVLKD